MIAVSSLEAHETRAAEELLAQVFGEDYRALARHYLAAMFSSDFRRPHFIVAREGTEIVGILAYSEELFTVDVWGLSWVAVAPAHRGQGVGQQLVETATKAIRAHASPPFEVILATYPHQTGLYDKCGFKTLGESHYMVKTLVAEKAEDGT